MANSREESFDPEASRCSHPMQHLFLLVRKNEHWIKSCRVPVSHWSQSDLIEWCRNKQGKAGIMWRLWQGALSQSKLLARKKKQVQRMLGGHPERATSGRPQTRLKIPRISSTCTVGLLPPTTWSMAISRKESRDPEASRCSHPMQHLFLLVRKNEHWIRSCRVPVSHWSRSDLIEWCRNTQGKACLLYTSDAADE